MRVFRIVLWWRLRFCVVFILWTVCVSDQTRLSESKVRGKVMWISTSVPYFAPASAILKECIFFFFYKIISVCTWHLLPRGWCLGHCSGSSPLSPSWLAWKFKTIFLTSSALPSHSLSSSRWQRQTLLEATPIPHLTPGVLPLSFHQLLKNYSLLQIFELPVALTSWIKLEQQNLQNASFITLYWLQNISHNHSESCTDPGFINSRHL